jgi:hypothetical protein
MGHMDNLTLDTVDIETAISLYNQGWNIETNYFFRLREDVYLKTNYVEYEKISIRHIDRILPPAFMYSAPELELVSKWLMEKYDINITVCLLRKEFGHSWYYNIDHINADKILHRWNPKINTYHKYEEALSEGIKHSLKLMDISSELLRT